MSFIFPPNSKMYLDFTNGIIGVGTTNPTSNLHVVGNLTVTGDTNLSTISFGNGIKGILNTATQPNITSVGTLTGLTVSGTGITGTLNTASQTNINLLGTLTNLTVNTGLFVSSAGNVGMGTPAPNANLHVVGPVNLISSTGPTGLYMRLGNVGIGTTNPLSNLHIIGNTITTGLTGIGNLSATANLTIYCNSANTNNESGIHGLLINSGTGTDYSRTCMYLGADASGNVAYIQSSRAGANLPLLLNNRGGGVGIGTTTLFGNTHIHANSNVTTCMITSFGSSHLDAPDSTNKNQLLIRSVGSSTNSNSGTFPTTGYSLGIGVDGSVGTNGIAYINYAGNANYSTLGLQTRGGNVGVGTTNANYTLDVNGPVNIATSLRLFGRGPFRIDYGTFTTGTIAAGGSSSGISVSFNITFNAAPIITCTCNSSWGHYALSDAENATTTGFTAYVSVSSSTGGGSRTYTFAYIAIGL